METVMATPAQVAARDGVTKQAVTKTVRQLVATHGLPVERDGRGRVTRFSLAHYDHIRGQFVSSERTAAARSGSPGRPASPADPGPATNVQSRDEALRQEAWLKVGREKLRRQEEVGQLIRADRTRQALTACGREIQSLVARLPNRADDLALVVSREGVHGLRMALRRLAGEVNGEIADRLEAIFEDAPEYDPAIEGEAP